MAVFDRTERCRQVVGVARGGWVGRVFGIGGDRSKRNSDDIGEVAGAKYRLRSADAVDTRRHVCVRLCVVGSKSLHQTLRL